MNDVSSSTIVKFNSSMELVSESAEWILRAAALYSRADDTHSRAVVMAPAAQWAPRFGRIVKACLYALYWPFRPIIRPLFWRVRNFLVYPIVLELTAVRRDIQVLTAELATMRRELGTTAMAQQRDVATMQREIAHLAQELDPSRAESKLDTQDET